MKIAVAYTCVAGGDATLSYITRFASTYHAFDAGIPHTLLFICNNGKLDNTCRAALSGLNGTCLERSNNGWDIGGYIESSNGVLHDFDFVLFTGQSVYFHRPGWLARLVEARSQHGDGLYGVWATNVVRPHIITTAFATSPDLLRRYPHRVLTKEQRYVFEHGTNSFWHWLDLQGKPARLVTWDGSWGPKEWRAPKDIIWRGDQSNCLAWCNHTDSYSKSTGVNRQRWQRLADLNRI